MDNLIELGLLGVLLVVLYVKDTIFSNLINNKVGKIALLSILFYFTKYVSITSGMIIALITIILITNHKYDVGFFNEHTDLDNDADNTVRHHYTLRDMENIINHTREINTLNASAEF